MYDAGGPTTCQIWSSTKSSRATGSGSRTVVDGFAGHTNWVPALVSEAVAEVAEQDVSVGIGVVRAATALEDIGLVAKRQFAAEQVFHPGDQPQHVTGAVAVG